MTRERRSLCRKHKWKRKGRGNKRPGSWSSTSISSRINSGSRIPGFWSSYYVGIVTKFSWSRSDGRLFRIDIDDCSFPLPSVLYTTSIPLFQLLHLQIMVNVSHAGGLSWVWAELGPATDIGSTVHAGQYTQPSFCSRCRLRR
jgi:hypothetical protein